MSSSNQKEVSFQKFLTLMDNIHDFGNTGRADKALKGTYEEDEIDKLDDDDVDKDMNEDDEEDITIGKAFNTSFLIDFLMLGYMHDEFKKLINIDFNQNYIKNKSNCINIPFKNSANPNNTTKKYIFKSDSLPKTICQKFYFPTYANKIIFRSKAPEKITRDILIDYLEKERMGRKIKFDEKNMYAIPNDIDTNYNFSGKIRKSNCLILNLGNKDIKSAPSRLNPTIFDEFQRYKGRENNVSVLSKYKYKREPNKNKLHDNYKVYTCDGLYKHPETGKVIYPAKPASGVFQKDRLDTISQGKIIYEALKEFYGVTKITYITDANQMNNEWFSVEKGSHYLGKFNEYDSFKIKKTEVTNNNGNSNSGFGDEEILYVKKEFQEYSLLKTAGELLFIDEFRVKPNLLNNDFLVEYKINGYDEQEIDTKENTNSNSKKDPRGLSLFLLLFNEINKKTLGFKQIGSLTADKVKKIIYDIKNVGLKALESTYKITLKLKKTQDEENNNATEKLIPLFPTDFIMCLLDFKRSMDYLYVKACQQANTRTNIEYTKNSDNNQYEGTQRSAEDYKNHKYVFVSTDRSAVCYSLMLGNPTILTTPVVRSENSNEHKCHRGSHLITVYNPLYGTNANVQNARNNAQVKARAQAQNARIKSLSNTEKKNAEFARREQERLNAQNLEIVENAENAELEKLLEDEPPVLRNNDRNTNVLKMRALAAAAAIPDIVDEIDELEAVGDIDELFKDKCKTFKIDLAELNKKERGRIYDPFRDKNINKANKQFEEIMKGILKQCEKYPSSGGANSKTQVSKSLLNQQIPLTTDLETICEVDSPMYIFFDFYGQLTPTISFFWFMIFKCLLYFTFGDDMDISNCKKFKEMNKSNVKSQNIKSNILPNVSINSKKLQNQNNIRQNNNTRSQRDQQSRVAPAAGGKKINKIKK
jgi:hypothetical protein